MSIPIIEKLNFKINIYNIRNNDKSKIKLMAQVITIS